MKNFFKSKAFKVIKNILIILLAAALVFGGFKIYKHFNPAEKTEGEVATAVVTRRNIVNTVTGSGTVQAYESYDIIPTVTGEIVFCDVEEGDRVTEGQTLYMFDTETSENAITKAQNSVENARLSLEQAQENVENLTIKAPIQGVVSGITLKIGDKAQGTVCTIVDNTYMIAQIPVSTALVGNVSEGDRVRVGIASAMMEMNGIVDRVTSSSVSGENGTMVTWVDVRIDNPGSIAEGTYVSATFITSKGEIEGAQAGQAYYSDEAKATAEQSGTVAKLNVKNGDWVNKGDVIAILSNTQVENSLRTARINYADAQTSLSDKVKAAEDYIITAPIDGMVMSKDKKKGDTVAGQNSVTLMTVADTTRMKFTINVDELDVAKINKGQTVSITSDAIEGARFTGVIETISTKGNASNGVTSYPVVVRIDEPGDLRDGMNVNAEIIVESAYNVISVPSGAVTYYDGKYYVTVVGEAEGVEDNLKDMPQDFSPENMKMPERGEMPTGDVPQGFEMPTGDRQMPERGERGSMPQRDASKAGGREAAEEPQITMYDEPKQIEVTVGVTDDDYTEIKSGLTVGMVVNVVGSSNESSGFGFGGGMPGGGMPMGGGGMPGGGMPMGRMR